MFLKSISLENIRSYTKQTIHFSQGSTLLAGDIGSGKSSLLLAIEFALFGCSRPDLPAQALLKKGENEASVTLNFTLEGKEYTIKRALKKESKTIKQLPGHIIVQGVKKELMPSELKAQVIKLLGYPEDYITKNKNYLFRYTIYTPQEQMKAILYETAQTRLDVLRQLFNIDKYKTVRDNISFYLRHSRALLSGLKEVVKPLPEKRKEKEAQEKEIVQLQEKERLHKQTLTLVQEELTKAKTIFAQLEKEQKIYETLVQEITTKKSVLKAKKEQQEVNEKQIKLTLEELSALQEQTLTLEQVHTALEQVNARKQEVFKQKTMLEQERVHLTQRITQEEKNIEEMSKKTTNKEQLDKQKKEYELIISKEAQLLQLQEQCKQELTRITQNKAKQQTLFEQAQSLQERITHLNSCPTCLQDVSIEYKEKIKSEQENAIQKAQKILKELQEYHTTLTQKQEKNEEQIALVRKTKQELTRISEQLAQYKDIQEQITQKQTLLKEWKQKIATPLPAFNEQLTKFTTKITQLEQAKTQLQKQDLLQKQLKNLQEQQHILNEFITVQEEVINAKQLALSTKQNHTQALLTYKQDIEKTQEREKTQALVHKEVLTSITHKQQLLVRIEKEITQLREKEKELHAKQKTYNWLEGHFLPLTQTIEKHVMYLIYQQFNEIFQEWFSLLIDDPTLYARLNDDFSPIVEHNGHEISFHNLSGGEKTSTALAYRLALHKVVNEVVDTIKTKELLILDEPTDGFSGEQLNKVRDVLDRLALDQLIIVSHEAKVESFVEHVIRIEKSTQGSTIT